MSIYGIGTGYPTWREMGETRRNGSGTGFGGRMVGTETEGNALSEKAGVRVARQNTALEAYRASAASAVRNIKPAYEAYESENDKNVPDSDLMKTTQETTTDIIVKPDGSRVLVVTISIGGMETTMSLEISKPTEAPNEISEDDIDNNMPSGDAGMAVASDEMWNISTEA